MDYAGIRSGRLERADWGTNQFCESKMLTADPELTKIFLDLWIW
jgi:hypothetical protein